MYQVFYTDSEDLPDFLISLSSHKHVELLWGSEPDLDQSQLEECIDSSQAQAHPGGEIFGPRRHNHCFDRSIEVCLPGKW